MAEENYGPNGGLVYCMEYRRQRQTSGRLFGCVFSRCLTRGFRYLVNHLDWLEDELGDYADDYLIVDCPGTTSALRPVASARTVPCG